MLRRCFSSTSSSLSLLSNSVAVSSSAATIFASVRFTANKETTADDAAYLIKDGDTIAVGGFVASCGPEAVLEALGRRYEQEQHPKDLNLVFLGGPGHPHPAPGAPVVGIDHLAKPGMLRRTFGAHYGQCSRISKMVSEGQIAGTMLPMGAICRMIREPRTSAGYLTKIGIGTVMDPRVGHAGKLTADAPDGVVQLVTIDGEEYLRYLFPKDMPGINVAIVRGTSGCINGNISAESEPLYLSQFIMAAAATANRGTCIAQVERIVEANTLPMKSVVIPHCYIDALVAAPLEKHPMSYGTLRNPAATGEIRKHMSHHAATAALDMRKVIGRRAAYELQKDFRVNYGIGLPEAVAQVAQEENIADFITPTVEAGAIGGLSLSKLDFGCAENASCLIKTEEMFDFYNNGGLDASFLGAANVSEQGDVNVLISKGAKMTGLGGFQDIAMATPRVTFLTQFTIDAKMEITKDGKLQVVKEGAKKFVKSLGKNISFAGGNIALKKNQHIRFVTERCVLQLVRDSASGEPKLLLQEIAPGIDLDRDILQQMEFAPLLPDGGPRLMDSSIFLSKTMNLRKRFFVPDMSQRAQYHEKSNTLFVNLSNVDINSSERVEEVLAATKAGAAKAGDRKMHVIANYYHFSIDPDFVDEYRTQVREFHAKHSLSVRRYSSRAFRASQLASLTPSDIASVTTSGNVSQLMSDLQMLSPAAKQHLENADQPLTEEQIEAIMRTGRV